ncbi:MAG: S8 family serine peptidase [Planctomycetes bacterium]|nr:S8 family serine peptidase [Planctomycetota bacterium]
MLFTKYGAALAVLLGVAFAATSFAQQNAPKPLPAAPESKITYDEANQRASLPRWLSLKYAEFDTTGAEPEMEVDLVAPETHAGEIGYYLVQLHPPITDTAKATVTATGAQLLDYVPNNTFIVRASTGQLEQIMTMSSVAWTGAFHPAYRLDARIREISLSERHTNDLLKITVVAFPGISKSDALLQITERGATVLASYEDTDRVIFDAVAAPSVARWLAQAPDIQWVEPASVITSRNTTEQWTIQTFVSGNTKIFTKGIHGENQVAGHMDDGMSTTSCYFADPNGNPIGPNHRKIVYYGGSVTNSVHGTHTAGTTVGDPFPVNGTTTERGHAYLAKIAHTTGFPTSTFNSTAVTHANNGARAHTNSWGNDTTTAYDTLCNQIDTFSWNNEDNVVLFAATDTSSLKNPENAKDLIAVEASQNGASANSFCVGGAGPTSDGRRKPEVCTPGCSTISAGTGSCNTATLTGTSMACPSATGACLLIRQYFTAGFYPTGAAVPANALTPTGALIKAVEINSCVDMTGVAGYPSNQEGWGRLQMDQGLSFTGDTRKLIVKDVRKSVGMTTGQTKVYTFSVTSSSEKLAVTLAFHDAPGTINAANPVINNLDLKVTAPGNINYLGNVFTSGFSSTGGVADAKNNVERVLLNNPTVGVYTVTITATSVPTGPQGFGLAINGAVSETPVLTSVSPNPVAVASPLLTPTITISGSGLLGTTSVAVGSTNYAGGFLINNDNSITLWFIPPPAQLGSVNVTVTSPAGTSNAIPITINPVATRFVFFDKNPVLNGTPLTIYMASPSVGFYPILAYSSCIVSTPIPPYMTYGIGGCGDLNFSDPVGPFASNGITQWNVIVPAGISGTFYLQYAEIDVNNQIFPLTMSLIAGLVIN